MLELNAELFLSENIKTPISKNLVTGKHDALLISGILMRVNLRVCTGMCAGWR